MKKWKACHTGPPSKRDGPGLWSRHLEQDGAASASIRRPVLGVCSLWLGFWQGILCWLRERTFAPSWLPGAWRTPIIGYLVAIALQGIFVTVSLLLVHTFPTFAFAGVLEVVIVALIALQWGAGPSLVATLTGALLLEFVTLPPAFAWNLAHPQHIVELLLFLLAGVLISVVASQHQRARRNAENLTLSLAVEQAHLNAIIEAIPDVVALYDAQGALVRLNHAGQHLSASATFRSSSAATLPGPSGEPLLISERESFLPPTFPLERVLAGETLVAWEVQVANAQEQKQFLSISAAPLRDQHGQVGGAVSILRDVTTLRQNEQALREANQQMSDFLSLASHELRTPLTGLVGHLQLVQRRLNRLTPREGRQDKASAQDETDRRAQVEEPLWRAEQQAQLMNRLVGDLLDASRIQADRLTLRPGMCHLTTIVQEAVEEQRLAWTHRTITLDLPDEPPVPFLADADRIGQVVTNYLTNALKYSPEDQPVEVSLQVEGGQARVLVRDHGPGVPAAEQEHIWERFHRAPGIEVQDGSGVGLGVGLHISRTIIERHQGQVGVESQPGQGSTFWFTLPLINAENQALTRRGSRESEHIP
jgi:signal transduction histidine kinase